MTSGVVPGKDAGWYEWHSTQKRWHAWKNWFEPMPWYKRFYYFWTGKHYNGFHAIDESGQEIERWNGE